MSESINHELIEIALGKTSGDDFEKFSNALLSGLLGAKFIPLGGRKDGGADAVLENVFVNEADAAEFFQASTQKDESFQSKIRRTILRLKEVNRAPRSLIYVTSRRIQLLDKEESALSKELGVHVRIRDLSYIVSHTNDTVSTRQAYWTYLSHYTEFLKRMGKGIPIENSVGVKSPEIYVFLRQELDRRKSNEPIAITFVDSLIIWALEGTNPEKNIFLTEDQILERVKSVVPNVHADFDSRVRRRLNVLSSKTNEIGLRIRFYKKEDHYCLPSEQRDVLEKENLEDASLRQKVLVQFRARIDDYTKENGGTAFSSEVAAQVALQCIDGAFEKGGLQFVAYLNGEDDERPPLLAEFIDEKVRARFRPDQFEFAAEAIAACLRGAIYSNSDVERDYFDRLSRTYVLLLSLQADQSVVSYFEELTGNLRLLIGADIVIQALSERYVKQESKNVQNMLAFARKAGATLVLSEPVLEEVISHLRATDFEFKNHYQSRENYLTKPFVSHCNRILIRAYFNAKFDKSVSTKPKNWTSFVDQFCSPDAIHQPAGIEQLRDYMIRHFKFEYLERDELVNSVEDPAGLEALARELQMTKKKEQLANNDALMIHAVYGLRKKGKESAGKSAFGFATWWLTNEFFVVGRTRELVKKRGSRYLMRPDFLLNFLSLSPKTADVRRTYDVVFPSVVGLSVGRRVGPESLENALEQLRAFQEIEPARVAAKVSELSDKLKSDLNRKYDRTIRVSKG